MQKGKNEKKNVEKQHSKIVEKNVNEKEKEVKILTKMQLAAKKAWETRRANKKGEKSMEKKKQKNVKELAKEVIEKADVFEKKELAELNGKDIEKLQHENKKKMDRKAKMEDAKNGKTEVKAVEVGKIIKNARVERFSGGFKVVSGSA